MSSEDIIHDVLIIGAGPCGLALAARLCEPFPSALFTENEHRKFHILRSSTQRRSKPARTSRRVDTGTDRFVSGPCVSHHGLDIKVLDSKSDTWMSSWNEKFEQLGIEHLRSPMFFHPDPKDRDGLLAFAYMNGREGELKEIHGVVGKELSKHHRKKKQKDGRRGQETTYIDERDRQDYHRPSQALFRDYCQEIIKRYGLTNAVEKSIVTSISYDDTTRLFDVQSTTGTKKARIVVLAVGSGQEPRLPLESPFNGSDSACSARHIFEHSQDSETILPASLLKDGHHKTLAIVGGGLTSAQIAQVASAKNIGQIHLILRGPLKTKHFDVDLCWLAKFKNESMSRFWKADEDHERWLMMKEARNGGSVNPEYRDIIRNLVTKGKLQLWEWTDIQEATLNENDKSSLHLSSPSGSSEVVADAVIYATGEAANIEAVEALKPMLRDHPIEVVGGMPCLTSELMWSDDVPLFVTGKLGGLRLGPAAGNLEGARLGAEFIAGKIAAIASTWQREDNDESLPEEINMSRLGLGRANQFEILEYHTEEEGIIRPML